MVIYAISDIHTDYPENLKWMEDLPKDKYKNDVVILAG
jgi:predicted phosphodiesterase